MPPPHSPPLASWPAPVRGPAPLPGQVLASVPLTFVPNTGQFDGRVSARALFGSLDAWFTEDGVTLAAIGPTAEHPVSEDQVSRLLPGAWARFDKGDPGPRATRWTLRAEFAGAVPQPPMLEQPRPGTVSIIKGDPTRWRSGIPTFGQVRYSEPWPGVEVTYSSSGKHLKSSYRVQPGADPAQIGVAYRGITDARLDEAERLVLISPIGELIESAPVAWQEDVDGTLQPVPVRFTLGLDDDNGHALVGFDVGTYDSTKELVIDPTLEYSGFLGGNGIDRGHGVAVDGAGNAYVTGETTSSEGTFPDAVGPDVSFNGVTDAFVAKVSADGGSLVYAGYIGGGSEDIGLAIAVDSAGAAYVTGSTQSSQATFPELVGPDLSFNGGEDAFIAKVRPDGLGLVYAGYIGGAAVDWGQGIALNGLNEAYVTGTTGSDQTTFPVLGGPDLTQNGARDAFITHVNASGTGILYSGYIGGTGDDYGFAVAVDGSGSAYIAGQTASTEASFPEFTGPDLTYNGVIDAFVAKVEVRPIGVVLTYAGYIGGSLIDSAYGIAVDSSGAAYVTGGTASSESSFPVTGGPDPTYNGGGDAFVVKVRPDGLALEYAGYIGGIGDDFAHGIAVDSAGAAYVAGYTSSTEATFPVKDAMDPTHNSGYDAFVAKVSVSGSGLVYAGYIGGANDERAKGIAVDRGGRAVVTGHTLSTQASFPVLSGPDATHNGDEDAFVSRIGCSPRNVVLSVVPFSSNTLQVTVTRGGLGYLRELRFQSAGSSNITVTVGSFVNQAPPFVYVPSAPTVTQVFTIQRIVASGSGTLTFHVLDDCGLWPTLAGGGPNAWPVGSAPDERSSPVGFNAPPRVSPTPAPTPDRPSQAAVTVAPVPGAACVTFTSHSQAQAYLRRDPADPLLLDRNRNGIACEGADGAGFVSPPLDLMPVPRP